jgi:hypothetical protein
VIEVERIAGPEVEGELAAFRAQPEPIFAAEDIHVRLSLARRDRRPPNPSEARRVAAAGRARHDASLVRRGNRDLRGSGWVGEHDNLRVLSKEGDVRVEARRAHGPRWAIGTATCG